LHETLGDEVVDGVMMVMVCHCWMG